MGSAENVVPIWINADNFSDLVRKDVKSYDKIMKFDARSALEPGENYSSVMIRVNIDAALKDETVKNQNTSNNTESSSVFCCKTSKKTNKPDNVQNNSTVKTQHISYMVKVPHNNEEMLKMLESFDFFRIESTTLRELLPKFEGLFKAVGVDVNFGPKAHILPKHPDGSYVLMDDLGMKGFRNASRTECLDMDHVHLVLKKLAQYHAATAVYMANNGPYADHYMIGLNNDMIKTMWNEMMLGFKDAFMKNVKTYRDGEKYEQPMTKFFDTLRVQFDILFGYDPDEFNVLSHGDCWSNNILFNYSDVGKVKDIIFVDYQLPSWSSPVKDLLYFILTSTQIDIKFKHFDYFLRFYHEHLTDSLKLLKYPKEIPTLRALHMQSYKYGGWATLSSVLTLPIVLLDSSKNSQLENLMNSSNETSKNFKDQLYANKRYHTHINEHLPWLYQRGFMGDTNTA